MAYSIYGGRLEEGYCEVHPHVNEPYPCSLCVAENEPQPQQEHSKEQELEYNLGQADAYIKELTASIAALEADKARLVDALKSAGAQFGHISDRIPQVPKMSGTNKDMLTEYVSNCKSAALSAVKEG